MHGKFNIANIFLILCAIWHNHTAAINAVCICEGYIADPSSADCTTYIECVARVDGTYTGTSYTCPDGTLFNPNTTYCQDKYKCPTRLPSETIDTDNSNNSTSGCTSYIADPSSTDCTAYILCVAIEDGIYLGTDFTCPDGTFYNPNTTYCDENYKCTTRIPTETVNTDNSNNSTSTCTSEGYIVDPSSADCTTYIKCVAIEDGIYSGTRFTCPDGTLFNPNTTYCDENYKCTTRIPTEIIDTDNSNNSTLTCTSEGYIADPSSTNCTTYIECVAIEDGIYSGSRFTCPDSTLFNPNTTYCEDKYKCPTRIPTEIIDTDNFDNSTCTSEGYIADPSSADCTAYIECVVIEDGIYLGTRFTCPDGTLYNPNTTYCDDNYKCPTRIPTETVDIDNSNNSTSGCTCEGYIEDPSSFDCTAYIECVAIEDGIYLGTRFTCPDGTLYNPNTTYCDDNYQCQTRIPTEAIVTDNSNNSTSTCTSEGYIVDPSSADCTTYIKCVAIEDGIYSGTRFTCPDGTLFNPNTTYCDDNYQCQTRIPTEAIVTDNSNNSTSTCTSEGYIADPSSTNCTAYIECVAIEVGIYSGTRFTCPDGTLFNPKTTYCDDKFKCLK